MSINTAVLWGGRRASSLEFPSEWGRTGLGPSTLGKTSLQSEGEVPVDELIPRYSQQHMSATCRVREQSLKLQLSKTYEIIS